MDSQTKTSVHTITSSHDLDTVLKENKLVIVDFYADWCPPCKAIAPKFANLAEEIKKVKFAKLNIDSLSELAVKYSIRSVPTFLVFANAKLKQTCTGVSIDEIRRICMEGIAELNLE